MHRALQLGFGDLRRSDSATPTKPFMSQAPRPNNLPSRISALNGSLDQSCPSTGTTSVWPDST